MTVPSPYADRLRRLPVQRHEVEVRGATTAYWVYGPEDAETTVIAVHGFRGEHHGLEPVLAFLPEVRVIAPDLPGFGESAPVPRRTHDLDEYAEWLTDFVAEVAPGAVILGHSFVADVAEPYAEHVAEANDVKLDAQLRTELNAVTSRLGDELRAENSKVAAWLRESPSL